MIYVIGTIVVCWLVLFWAVEKKHGKHSMVSQHETLKAQLKPRKRAVEGHRVDRTPEAERKITLAHVRDLATNQAKPRKEIAGLSAEIEEAVRLNSVGGRQKAIEEDPGFVRWINRHADGSGVAVVTKSMADRLRQARV